MEQRGERLGASQERGAEWMPRSYYYKVRLGVIKLLSSFGSEIIVFAGPVLNKPAFFPTEAHIQTSSAL